MRGTFNMSSMSNCPLHHDLYESLQKCACIFYFLVQTWSSRKCVKLKEAECIVCVDQMQTQYYSSPSMPERERGAGPIWWLVIIFATILFPILRRHDLAKNIVCQEN